MRNQGAASRPPTAKGLADIGVQDIEACTHLSPKGAIYLSPGQRPGCNGPSDFNPEP